MLRSGMLAGSRADWLAQASDAEALLGAVLDSVDCGVLVFGPDGSLRTVNDGFGKIFGLDPHGLRGVANFETLVLRLKPHLAHSEATTSRWRQRFEREESCWDELELVLPERKMLERFARPVLDADGQRLGWTEIYRDVTHRRLMEAKLFHTARVAALGQLVTGIAHELNNPLTSIVGYAQILARRRNKSDDERDAGHILQEAERAARIAKNLLRFARDTKLERTHVDLNELAERTLDLHGYQLRLDGIAVVLELDPAALPILADAAQVQQVLLNLVLNAEQAIQQGGVPGHIWVRTYRPSADRVAFEIADDGPGVAPEIAPRIFDPFFTTKPAGVGTGLGLSIVFGIVQEHGGVVSLRRRLGGGALFTVELPMTEPASVSVAVKTQSPEGAVPAETNERPSRAAGHRERILVVEDEPTVARLIADVLGEEGHPVDTLLDSREALEWIARNGYDLVVCDLRMPHLDGRGLYRELVRQGSPLEHRLFFVTGDTLAPHTVQFLEASGVPYLAKPFLVEELKEAVQNAIATAKERESDAIARDPERLVWPIRSASSKR